MAAPLDCTRGELWRLRDEAVQKFDDMYREFLSILDDCGLCLDASGATVIEKSSLKIGSRSRRE